MCDDVTSEALTSLLADQGGNMAMFSAEGGIFDTMAGRYSEGFPSIDVYLKGYSQDTLRVDRKGRPPEFVHRPTLTMCVCVQPDVLRKFSMQPEFRGRGLLARPFYLIPRSRVGYREQSPPPVTEETKRAYNSTIRMPADFPRETTDVPHLIRLAPAARSMFHSYLDELLRHLRPGGLLRDIRD